MKKLLLIVTFILFAAVACAQTMIEVIHPELADIVLVETSDSTLADIVVYKTRSNKYADEWMLRWKFKKWGFANFAVYITDDPLCGDMVNDDTGKTYQVDAVVYFTPNCEEARYRKSDFMVRGMMRVQRRLYLPGH